MLDIRSNAQRHLLSNAVRKMIAHEVELANVRGLQKDAEIEESLRAGNANQKKTLSRPGKPWDFQTSRKIKSSAPIHFRYSNCFSNAVKKKIRITHLMWDQAIVFSEGNSVASEGKTGENVKCIHILIHKWNEVLWSWENKNSCIPPKNKLFLSKLWLISRFCRRMIQRNFGMKVVCKSSNHRFVGNFPRYSMTSFRIYYWPKN